MTTTECVITFRPDEDMIAAEGGVRRGRRSIFAADSSCAARVADNEGCHEGGAPAQVKAQAPLNRQQPASHRMVRGPTSKSRSTRTNRARLRLCCSQRLDHRRPFTYNADRLNRGVIAWNRRRKAEAAEHAHAGVGDGPGPRSPEVKRRTA